MKQDGETPVFKKEPYKVSGSNKIQVDGDVLESGRDVKEENVPILLVKLDNIESLTHCNSIPLSVQLRNVKGG